LDLFDFAGKWEHLNDQISALKAYEADLKQDREETELKEVIDLLLADKVINAIKKYKEITGASLADSRDYVRKVMQPKYC
jgi:ribosomal protein L7/L12